MAGLTLDAGALIAADRDDKRFWSFWSVAVKRRTVATIPATIVAQAWRSPRNVRMAQVINQSIIEAYTFDIGRLAGQLCAAANKHDVVDAGLVVSASIRGDDILTTDPTDLLELAQVLGSSTRIMNLASM